MKAIASFLFSLWLVLLASNACAADATADKQTIPGGALHVIGKDGIARGGCPLKHTDVNADVAGFLGRVTVKQTFQNPLNEKIEAVYVFPLPDDAAVDRMTMTVGERKIVGHVKKREEARQIYDRAVAAGQVASLLDQERPNVFTQSVANVEPGATVEVEIGYTQTLKFEDGIFEFSFPMVVGPRYMPGQPSGNSGTGTAPDTDKVPDASRVSPPITPEGTRAGHDVSLTLHLDAGMPINSYESPTHRIDTVVTKSAPEAGVRAAGQTLPTALDVKLKDEATIPNKDFVFRYGTSGAQVQDAFMVHKDERGQFFTLILQPPAKVKREETVARELIFVIDTSGSMQGYPLGKAKLVMSQAIDALGPQDTFNLITFSGDTHVLWDKPRPNTKENRDVAQQFLATRQGGGGTEMMKAIDAALVQPATGDKTTGAGDPIRVACFMTDGYVGNDMEIIGAVKKNAGTTRVFSFGIGSSVNRFLLDGMAAAGRGEVEYVLLESQSDEAARRFYQRVDAPVLTDVSVDWGELAVADVYPKQLVDLWSVKPVVLHGRLKGEVKPGTTITLRGRNATGNFERHVAVAAAAENDSHEVLASLWARAKASDLMTQDMAALQNGSFPEPLKNELTALGVEFRLMTHFTSFVAVEEMTVTKGGKPTTIAVPVEMPEGVSYDGIFGDQRDHPGPMAGSGGFGVVPAVSLATAASSPATPAVPAAAKATGGEGPMQLAGVKQELAKLDKLSESNEQLKAVDKDSPPDPLAKLDPTLRTLASRVDKEGAEGNFNADGFIVVGHKVDIMVYLADAKPETLEALKKLGFVQTGESKAVSLVIGTIDVRKLEELVKLAAVRRVAPVS